MKILFSGGGTLGSVTPLLAIKETIKSKKPKTEFIWVGTQGGVEKQVVVEQGIKFIEIFSGKLRRYLSFLNFIDIFKVLLGFLQSFVILWKEKPDICVSAGGFVSVPVHIVAWIFGIPCWIHQQDVDVGLSNKIMSLMANKITTALEQNIKDFKGKKVEWLGNPIRKSILSGNAKKIEDLGIKTSLPVVLVMGGGTGSAKINSLTKEMLPELEKKCFIVHLTGNRETSTDSIFKNYKKFIFLGEELAHFYAAASIVISRGGFGALSELAALKKPAIIIPKKGHQEQNVEFLAKNQALLAFDETSVRGEEVAEAIKGLLGDKEKAVVMGNKLSSLLPKAKEGDVVDIVQKLIIKSK